jgi:hypothetical protein
MSDKGESSLLQNNLVSIDDIYIVHFSKILLIQLNLGKQGMKRIRVGIRVNSARRYFYFRNLGKQGI